MSLNLSGYFDFGLIRGGSFILLVAVLSSGCGSNPPKDMDVKFLKRTAAGIRHP